jgi:membrane protease YdiL (CAAX protease family)
MMAPDDNLKVNTSGRALRFLAPLIPYPVVGVGFLVLHNVWIAVVGYHAAMFVIVLASRTKIPFKQLFLSRNLRFPAVMSAVGACGGILLYFVWPLLSVSTSVNSRLQDAGLTAQAWPFFLGYFIMVNPIIEEYYWRGFLGSSSKKPVLNDLLFSGYHILVLAGLVAPKWTAAVFAVLAAGAWLWRQTDRISGGLFPSTASHIAADIAIIAVIYFKLMS